MSHPTSDQILDHLKVVQDPDLHRDIVSLGFVKDLVVDTGRVSFTLELTTPACPVKEQLEQQAKDVVLALPGVETVEVRMTSRVRGVTGASAIPGVQHVIAVGSGKGGVGKSTVAVNLALALAETGARIGLLDADIYGPTVPFMMGVHRRPDVIEKRIQPIAQHGIKLMSVGFLLEQGDDPVIWRGPMLGGILQQFLREVDWGELDYLLVDLPPGTGDVPLTLVQSIPMSGAAIVVTPQPVAATIGVKTLRMFQKTKVPILGLIENMARFVCPHCHEATPIFSEGGAALLARREQVPLLGEIPLDPAIRQSGDEGYPVFLAEPDGAVATAYRQMAGKLAAQIAKQHHDMAPALQELTIG